MKYPAQLYAKALAQALDKTPVKEHEYIAKRFAALIERNGDSGNYEKIALEIEKLMVKKDGGKFIEVELARPNEKLLKKILEVFLRKDAVRVGIREELLAGARILIDQERELDFSFASRLKKLFS